MTAEKILQSDVLDILFEGRNKLYGAYELRRTYNRRIKQSVGGMILTIGLLISAYFYSAGRQNSSIVLQPVEDTIVLRDINYPEKPKEVVPAQSASPLQMATVQETAPNIQPDKLVPQTEVHTQDVIDTSVISNTNQAGAGSDPGDVVPTGPPGDGKTGDATGDATVASEPIVPKGPIDMRSVDEVPEYPGGNRALINYMVRNLSSELEPGVKYGVRAQFVINEEGGVSEAIILHSDDEALNNQVLKAIRKMTRWKPGILHGQKVAVRFTMPVTFVGPDE